MSDKELEQAAEEYVETYCKTASYSPIQDVFKAGAMWERERIKKAWPNVFPYGLINEIINTDEDVTKQESFAIDAMWRLHSWLRERVLGDEG